MPGRDKIDLCYCGAEGELGVPSAFCGMKWWFILNVKAGFRSGQGGLDDVGEPERLRMEA